MASKFTLPFADVGAGITPSSGATLDFYDTGTYSRRDTYTDAGAGTANANPVVADSTGVFPAIFVSGVYRVVLSDSNGVQIWEEDNVSNFEGDEYAALESRVDTLETNAANTNGALINGLVPSNGVDTDHDIELSPGAATDSTGLSVLSLASALTKKTDQSWTAGDEQGGMFNGSVAGSTTYHMFLIERDSDGAIDAGYDTSITAANIPAGYTKYRRVFSFETDGSGNILEFKAYEQSGGGLKVYNIRRAHAYAATSPVTVDTSVAVAGLPKDLELSVMLWATLSNGTTAYAYVVPTTEDVFYGPGDQYGTLVVTGGGSDSTSLELVTNTSAEIVVRCSTSPVTMFAVNFLGWIDSRV